MPQVRNLYLPTWCSLDTVPGAIETMSAPALSGNDRLSWNTIWIQLYSYTFIHLYIYIYIYIISIISLNGWRWLDALALNCVSCEYLIIPMLCDMSIPHNETDSEVLVLTLALSHSAVLCGQQIYWHCLAARRVVSSCRILLMRDAWSIQSSSQPQPQRIILLDSCWIIIWAHGSVWIIKI